MPAIFYLLPLLIILTLPAHAKNFSAEGYWLTENKRAVIHTYECEQGLCGNIHWIIEGGMQYDTKNPEETKRSTPMCGLKIIWGFEKDDDEWENGKIYKADDGDVYSADIELKDENTLSLRGYIGIPLFGKSQIWSRVSPDEYKKCKAP